MDDSWDPPSSDTEIDDIKLALDSLVSESELGLSRQSKGNPTKQLFKQEITMPTDSSEENYSQSFLTHQLLNLKSDIRHMSEGIDKNYKLLKVKEEENRKLHEMALRLELTVQHLSDTSKTPCCSLDCNVF